MVLFIRPNLQVFAGLIAERPILRGFASAAQCCLAAAKYRRLSLGNDYPSEFFHQFQLGFHWN